MSELWTHLSEESFNDVLIGLASSETEAHLIECDICRRRLNDFQSDLDCFHEGSLAWSDSRSSSMRNIQADLEPVRRLYTPKYWAFALVVLLAIAVPLWHDGDRFWSGDHGAGRPPREDSATQIAQDNELLNAVNMVITQDDKSLVNEYQILDEPHPSLKVPPE